MIAVFDTNILYYITGISKSDLNATKLIENAKRSFDTFKISELAILEMYVKFRNDKSTIRDIIQFLAVNKIGLHKVLHQKYALVDEMLISSMHNEDIFNYIVDDSLRIKKEIENGYLRFWIICINALVIANKLSIDYSTEGFSSSTFYKNYLQMVLTLQDEKNYLTQQVYEILDRFYTTQKATVFKDEIIELMITVCEAMLGLYKTETSGQDFMEILIKQNQLSKDEYNIFLDNIVDEEMIKILEKRRIGQKAIVSKDMEKILKKNMNHFEDTLQTFVGKGESKYLSILFKNILMNKNKKIEKNSLIDSIYMKYYPEIQLITYDKEMLSYLKVIDSIYYNNIINFLNTCN